MRDWQVRPELSDRMADVAKKFGLSGTDFLELLVTAHLSEFEFHSDPDAAPAREILKAHQSAYSQPGYGPVRDLLDIDVPDGVDALIVRLPGHTTETTDVGELEFGVGLEADPHDVWVACRAESWAPAAPLPTHLVATRLGLILAVFKIINWDAGPEARATPAAGWRLDPDPDGGRAYPVGAGAHSRSRKLAGADELMIDPDYWRPGSIVRYPPGRRTSYRVR